MKVAYIRVSTVEQNEARQLEAMKDKGIEKYFTEKVSAKDTNRPKLQAMLDYVREGDTIYVHDFSRLARSTKDLLDITELLKAKGVRLVSNKENIDTNTPQGRLMLTMISAIYQFERENLLERQREGIDAAMANGVQFGRRQKFVAENYIEIFKRYENGEIDKNTAREETGASPNTFARMYRELKQKNLI